MVILAMVTLVAGVIVGCQKGDNYEISNPILDKFLSSDACFDFKNNFNLNRNNFNTLEIISRQMVLLITSKYI
jgi:hypothetical protein